MTVVTPLRHFSDPTNGYKRVFCEHWAQVSGKSVRGRTRSQAKLIWVLVDSEAFREVTWGYVRLEKRRHMGSGNPSQSWGAESISSTHTSGNNFDKESSYTSLNCCLRAQGHVEGTRKAWSPNRQAEVNV